MGSMTKLPKIINEDWAKVGATGAITCSIIGIIVNLLTIYVIWARKSIRKQSLAPLLLLLAISDFLLSSIGVPIQAARYINSEWSLPEEQCKYYAFYFYLNIVMSTALMTLTGVNRALALYDYRTAMKFFSWKNTSIIVAIVSIISGGVLASQWNKFEVKDETFSCTIGDPLPFQVLVGLLFFIGFSLMLGSNIYVYYKTKKCEKAIIIYLRENTESIDERIRQQNEARMHLESQFSRTVRWIFLTFIVLHFPNAILMVANPMPPNKDLVGLHIMGYWGSWISMFINPFVYFITNDFFKTATIKTFGNENFIQISTKRNTTVAEQEGFFGTVDRKDRNRINKIDVEMEQQQDIH